MSEPLLRMATPTSIWHRTTAQGDSLGVEFIPAPERFWPHQVLHDQPLDLRPARGRTATLEGSGALWMYAHAAAGAAANGAALILVRQPGVPEPIPVFPLEPPGPAAAVPGPWCRVGPPGHGGLRLECLPPAGGGKWPVGLAAAIPPFLASLALGGGLCLTGLAPNWMYAALAAGATRLGCPWITYFSPREGCPVVVHGAPEEIGRTLPLEPAREPAAPAAAEGICLGVVGDPNSGKSILAGILHSALRGSARRVWKLDCDGASPTPDWYLQMLQQGDAEAARQARTAQKRLWTPRLEALVAAQLASSKKHLDVVIADLPGGDHRATPPVRIPPGRELILREVDAFVILGRPGHPAAGLWQSALAAAGLGSRIAAIWESRSPDLPPAASVAVGDGFSTGFLQGLDRSQPPAALDLVARQLAPVLPVLLAGRPPHHRPEKTSQPGFFTLS